MYNYIHTYLDELKFLRDTSTDIDTNFNSMYRIMIDFISLKMGREIIQTYVSATYRLKRFWRHVPLSHKAN